MINTILWLISLVPDYAYEGQIMFCAFVDGLHHWGASGIGVAIGHHSCTSASECLLRRLGSPYNRRTLGMKYYATPCLANPAWHDEARRVPAYAHSQYPLVGVPQEMCRD